MKREELLKRLADLPRNTDILVRVGIGEVDIAEIVAIDAAMTARHSAALLLHPGDQQDLQRYRYAAAADTKRPAE